MNAKHKLLICFLITGLLIAGCGTGMSMVKGSLISPEENDMTGNRKILLCQIIGEVQKQLTDSETSTSSPQGVLQATDILTNGYTIINYSKVSGILSDIKMQEPIYDCTLHESTVASDSQGNFQIDEVQSGKYYILYDTGLSDFETGLKQWGGKTLKLSDTDWLINDYCGATIDSMTLQFLSGMSLSREGMLTAIHGLYVCDSPFVLALDPAGKFNAPLLLEVEGQSIEVEFKVGSFK